MTFHKSVIIQHPLHIPAVIETSRQICEEVGDSFYVLLKHEEEPCIIRGRGQAFSGTFERTLGYHTFAGIPEIKRQDGGNSWYHGDTTCFLRVSPYNKSKKFSHESFMEGWQETVKQLYEIFSKDQLQTLKGDPDLYRNNENNSQIFGTSGWNNSIARACWYEENLTDKSTLEYLISIDPQGDFKNSLGFAQDGFREFIQYGFSIFEEIPSSQYITDSSYSRALALQRKSGNLIGSCIGGEYPCYKKS